VNTGEGEATALDKNTRKPHYRVQWKTGRVEVGDLGIGGGTMEEVSGDFYDKGEVASTFKGDTAKADRAKAVLEVSGNIQVASKLHGASMTCDRVVWSEQDKTIKAFGHVKIFGNFGSMGTADEIWTTPDLNVFATPDMFKRK
jgi:hypothetical protein